MSFFVSLQQLVFWYTYDRPWLRYGMVWYGKVWYGMVWYDMVWYVMVWYGMVWYGMVWYGMVWYGMVWYGMVWYGMVWYGMVWCQWCMDFLGLFRNGSGSLARASLLFLFGGLSILFMAFMISVLYQCLHLCGMNPRCGMVSYVRCIKQIACIYID